MADYQPLNVRLSSEGHEAIRRFAIERDVTMASIIEALAGWIADDGPLTVDTLAERARMIQRARRSERD